MSEKHQCELGRNSLEDILKDYKRPVCSSLTTAWQKLVVASETHPLCRTFFRSEATLHAEIRRQLEGEHPNVIHPLSKFRIRYEVYLLVLYLMALFMGPIEGAFARVSRENFIQNYYPLQLPVDFLCQVDVVINFYTGYMIDRTRTVELRPSKIFVRYFFGYFFFDFLSAIPRQIAYHIVAPEPYPPPVLLGIFNLLRLFKIPRLITTIKILKRVIWYMNIKSITVYRTCALLIGLLYGMHFLACLQQLIPRTTHSFFLNIRPNAGWEYNYNLLHEKVLYKYFYSSFRASAYILGVRLSSIFNMVILPDYIVYAFTAVSGKIIVAVIWIVLAVHILNYKSMEIKYLELINQLNEFMAQKRLPPRLRERMREYYKFKYQKKYLKEAMIMGLLSENLKKQVNIASYKRLVSRVALFSELTPDQLGEIIRKLTSEIYLPTDLIFQSGSPSNAIYFVGSGTVAVFTHSGKELCHLMDGAYFGEVSLVIKGQTSMASIIAIETTQVFKLDKKHFDKIIMKNKEVYRIITANAERRLKEVMEAEEEYRKQLFEETYRHEH